MPHVSEAAGSPNPKPWAFNSEWSRSYVGNSTPPVNDSIFLTFTLASTLPPLPFPPPHSPVKPKKSLVSLSLFCHVARFPEAKLRYSCGDIPVPLPPTWPMMVAFWRSAVAERWADEVALFDEVGRFR